MSTRLINIAEVNAPMPCLGIKHIDAGLKHKFEVWRRPNTIDIRYNCFDVGYIQKMEDGRYFAEWSKIGTDSANYCHVFNSEDVAEKYIIDLLTSHYKGCFI